MQPRILKHNPAAEYFFEEGCFINELSNTDEDSQASVAQAKVRVGEATRWHMLEGITERYVILAGEGRVEVGQLEPCDVGPGDVVLIPPGCAQRIRNTGAEDLLFLAVCTPRFEPQYYRDIEPE